MGIYSTNRVGGITPFTESIDFSDPALLEGPSLMEACIQLHEMDQKMFETLIEFDFVSENNLRTMDEAEAIAMNEAADEAKTESIKDKIIKAIHTIIDGIKRTIAQVINKFKEIIKSDQRIIKKYDEKLTTENLAGFKGIKNFAMPKDYSKESNEFERDIKSLGDKLKDILKKNGEENDLDEFLKQSPLVLRISGDDAKEIGDKAKSLRNGFEEKVDSFVPDKKQLLTIKSKFKNTNEDINNLKKTASSTIAELNKLIGLVKAEKKVAKKNDPNYNGTIAKGYNIVYKSISKALKVISKATASHINTMRYQLSAYRKAYIICGKYALKKANGKSKESEAEDNTVEEAVDFAIAESSDLFVLGM